MARGTIKKLVTERGFGFIAPQEQGNDVFFHHSAVDGEGFDALQVGQSVEYEIDSGDARGKGPRARNVRPA